MQREGLKDNWKNMLQTLINNMPDGGVIKLHASFISNQDSKNKIYSIFNDIAPDCISMCDHKAIVELEMLFEKKNTYRIFNIFRKICKSIWIRIQ